MEVKKENILFELIISGVPMVFLYIFNIAMVVLFSIYEVFNNFDLIMHTAGGVVTAWSAYLFYKIFEKRKWVSIKPVWALAIVLVCATALVGIGWEVYEWYHDLFTPYKYQLGVSDTIGDLVLDVSGAVIFGIILFLSKRVGKCS